MENASKALIMAASVLLALLIIGTLVFMFNTISSLKSTEASTEEAQKLAEYNKQIETFNKTGLYGSEILSLANLIDDYNIRQSDLKGYTAITLEVYTKQIIDAIQMKTEYIGNNDYKNLVEDFEKLQSEVNSAKSKVLYGQTVEKLAGLKTNAIEEILKDKGITYSEERNSKWQNAMKEIDNAITDYTSKKAEMTEFKNKKFQTPEVEYDEQTGRVKKMIFREVGVY